MWRQLVRALDRPYRFLDKEKRLAAFRKSTSVLFERAQELPNLEFRASQVALYRHVEEKILQGCSIDYLEFGVWEGETVRQWTSINSSPHSRFFGFDTFEGLPEDWNAERQKGNFDLGGRPPIIDDPRVSFILGRFHESLPGFVETYKPRSRLVVHIDCDLYGSALCALTSCDRFLQPGSLVIFDEFYDIRNEYAAWQDYARAYCREATGVCYAPGYTRVALLIADR